MYTEPNTREKKHHYKHEKVRDEQVFEYKRVNDGAFSASISLATSGY